MIKGQFFNRTEKSTGKKTTLVFDGEKNGLWEVRELFSPTSEGDYPFYSQTYYLITTSDYWKENIIIEEIDNYHNEASYHRDIIAKKIAKRVSVLREELVIHAMYYVAKTLKMNTAQPKLRIEAIKEIIISKNSFLLSNYGLEIPLDNIPLKRMPKVSFMNGKQKICWDIVSLNLLEDCLYVAADDKNVPTFKVSFKDIVENDELYPIDFGMIQPFSSVFRNSECESLAKRVLYHTSSWDKPLTWEQYYETLSSADKSVAHKIKADFERIQPYIASPEACAKFSQSWNLKNG